MSTGTWNDLDFIFSVAQIDTKADIATLGFVHADL